MTKNGRAITAAALLAVAALMAVCLLTMEKIDLAEYRASVDYGSMNAEQVAVMQAILDCSASGDTAIDQSLTADEFDEVIDYIGFYFGTNLAHWNVALWRPGYAEVKPALLQELEQDKVVLDAEIDKALSGMYEGSDRFKLLQISNYIAATVRYSYSLDHIEPLSGLAGRGSCTTYSMLFYKMATRLGIEAYVCYGEVSNGMRTAGHAWNMVVLNGERSFYDITWYDTPLRMAWYVHSEAAWGRDFTITKLSDKEFA